MHWLLMKHHPKGTSSGPDALQMHYLSNFLLYKCVTLDIAIGKIGIIGICMILDNGQELASQTPRCSLK